MILMRRLFLYSILLFISEITFAQTSILTERNRSELSPSETRYNRLSTDMNVRKARQLYSNPAFYEVARQDSFSLGTKYHSFVSTGYSNGDVEGDFLPYEGNAFQDYRLKGVGQYSLKNLGTIFGSVQYSRGKHEQIGWNTMRYPELYLPYVATDSIGGDYKYEDYLVEGGYAFNMSDWTFGVHGSFHGEQAYRKTDPRALNNTTWLTLKLGAARKYNDHLFMLQGSFGRNKQNMSVRYWRPGEQDRFFVCYGFGLYDVRKSGVSFGYSRMHYIMEAGTKFTYHSPLNKPFVVFADLGYDYDRMKAEESDIRDLYYSKTHTLSPSLKFDWNVNSSFQLSLWLQSNIDKRKGFENIFEYYLVDEVNNIYDFRLIDTQQKYLFNKSESLAQLSLSYQINPTHKVSVQGGSGLYSREEKYKGEGYRVKNTSIYPHGKFNYLMNYKRSELELSFLYGKNLCVKNNYNVVLKNQSLEHLDFQQTFAPYAYFSSEFSSVQIEANYIYHFKKLGLGLNAKFMYSRGDRLNDVAYKDKIGFESTAPMIQTSPDKHNETWGSTSLFLIF